MFQPNNICSELPDELYVHIFCFLKTNDLLSVMRSNKHFSNLATSETVWLSQMKSLKHRNTSELLEAYNTTHEPWQQILQKDSFLKLKDPSTELSSLELYSVLKEDSFSRYFKIKTGDHMVHVRTQNRSDETVAKTLQPTELTITNKEISACVSYQWKSSGYVGVWKGSADVSSCKIDFTEGYEDYGDFVYTASVGWKDIIGTYFQDLNKFCVGDLHITYQ
jgi:hypothetical protein